MDSGTKVTLLVGKYQTFSRYLVHMIVDSIPTEGLYTPEEDIFVIDPNDEYNSYSSYPTTMKVDHIAPKSQEIVLLYEDGRGSKGVFNLKDLKLDDLVTIAEKILMKQV